MSGDSSDGSASPSDALLAHRRRFLTILGVGGAGALAGCAGDGGDGGTDGTGGDGGTDGDGGTPTTNTPPPENLPEPSGTFREARSSEASNLNFVYNQEAGAGDIIATTMDSLYTIRPNPDGDGFETFPLLGKIETVDESTYDITLRDNLEYSSEYGGVTASDFVYRVQNVYQADFSEEETGVDGGISNWTAYPDSGTWATITIEETGDLSFRLTLDSPDPAFPFRNSVAAALYAAPQALFEDYVDRAEDAVADMSGEALQEQLNSIGMELQNDETVPSLAWTGNLGPYNRESWEQGNRYVASRNEDYYLAAVARGEEGQLEGTPDVPSRFEKAPYFEEQDSQVVPEEASRLQALRNGEIDTAAVPPERVAEFDNLEQTYVQEQRQPFVTPVMWNMRANGWLPSREREVRQGMMMAIDKETFAANVFRGFALPAYTMQPQWSRWYPDESAVADVQFGQGDLLGGEMARQRIEEGLSKGDYPYEYDGETLINTEVDDAAQLSLIAQAGQPTETTIAEELSRQWSDRAGIECNIETVRGGAFQQQYAAPSQVDGEVPSEWSGGFFNQGPRDVATPQESWDLSLIFGFNTYPLTPGDSDVFFYEDGSINYYGYVPSEDIQEDGLGQNEIRSAYEEAAQTTDTAERRQALAEAFRLIAREQPFGFLAMEDDTIGYTSDYTGPSKPYLSNWDGVTYFKEESNGHLRSR
jgi:peptide/nickel transport system substrate-binding protein